MEESTAKLERSVAAPMIFIIVLALQFLSRYFEICKKKGSTSSEDMQLRAEINRLLREASALSQPSTFAQAAKLRRLATAKEKELAKNQEIRSREAKLSLDTYTKGLTILQVLTYFLLIIWFWRIPVASISKQLVQPFGNASGSSIIELSVPTFCVHDARCCLGELEVLPMKMLWWGLFHG